MRLRSASRPKAWAPTASPSLPGRIVSSLSDAGRQRQRANPCGTLLRQHHRQRKARHKTDEHNSGTHNPSRRQFAPTSAAPAAGQSTLRTASQPNTPAVLSPTAVTSHFRNFRALPKSHRASSAADRRPNFRSHTDSVYWLLPGRQLTWPGELFRGEPLCGRPPVPKLLQIDLKHVAALLGRRVRRVGDRQIAHAAKLRQRAVARGRPDEMRRGPRMQRSGHAEFVVQDAFGRTVSPVRLNHVNAVYVLRHALRQDLPR